METTPLHPIGARVTGLALSSATAADVDALKRLLADHGVLVLPGQHLADDGFVAFLRRLGTLTFTQGEVPVPGAPDLNVITNVGVRGGARSTFHVDSSYLRVPPSYTALRAVTIPSQGGETVFTDSYRAYDTLPEPLRERLAGRSITHVVTGVEVGPDDETEAVHPVFRRHPLTGRTAVYVTTPARCAHVSGLPDDEAAELVRALYEHGTREDEDRTLRHAWAAGDVVVWDNLAVLHRGDHGRVVGDRVMHRGMVAGYGAPERAAA